MPDNPLPDAKTQQTAESAEFNFSDTTTEAPRIRRRSLKSKQAGLTKAPETVPAIARELEKEAPPLSAEAAKAKPAATTTSAPPKTTPAIATTVRPTAPTAAKTASAPASASNNTNTTAATTPPPKTVPIGMMSPHPTRPATLYYSSQPRKEKEGTPSATPTPTTAPMKTIPTASTTNSTSQSNAATRPATSTASAAASAARPATASTATAIPTSVTRPATSTSRPASTTDYRANIERQKSEQKSVGSILSYIVYGMIAFFVLTVALAGYGGYILSQRITDQSVTVSQLDTKYADKAKELEAKLASTQDTLTQAQAQITRQNDLIIKQQDKMNQLIGALNDNTKAVSTEKQTRAQETAALRARVRELENQKPVTNASTRQ